MVCVYCGKRHEGECVYADLIAEIERQGKSIQSLAQGNLKLRTENDGLRQALTALKGGAE